MWLIRMSYFSPHVCFSLTSGKLKSTEHKRRSVDGWPKLWPNPSLLPALLQLKHKDSQEQIQDRNAAPPRNKSLKGLKT